MKQHVLFCITSSSSEELSVQFSANTLVLSFLFKRFDTLIWASDVSKPCLCCFTVCVTVLTGPQRVFTVRGRHGCSSFPALGVRLRIWLLSCSMSSGFCCCICWANCWPLQHQRQQNISLYTNTSMPGQKDGWEEHLARELPPQTWNQLLLETWRKPNCPSCSSSFKCFYSWIFVCSL